MKSGGLGGAEKYLLVLLVEKSHLELSMKTYLAFNHTWLLLLVSDQCISVVVLGLY